MPFNITNSVGRYAKNGAKKPGFWVAVGGTGTSRIMKSTDGGKTWNPATTFGGITTSICLSYANNLLVVGGEGGNGIATSGDGNNWASVTPPSSTNLVNVTILGYGKNATGDGLWVLSGYFNNSNTHLTTPNFSTWQSYTTSIGGISFSDLGRFVYANNLWVATGFHTANTIATSTNGSSWTRVSANGGVSTHAFRAAYGLDAFGAGLWVVVGQGANTIATSTTGSSWNGVTANGGVSTTARSVAYGKDGSGVGLWVVVGSGANTIATSTSGTAWTGVTTNGGMNTSGMGVAYGLDASGAGLWIAVGTGTNRIVTSPDGTNWTGKNQTGFSFTYSADVAYIN
jgi:hypothetical protein